MSQTPHQQPQIAPSRMGVNGFAIASLVLGIIAAPSVLGALSPEIGSGALSLALVPAILAIVLGYVARRQTSKIGASDGIALAGRVLGWIVVFVALGLVFVTYFTGR